MPEGVAGMRIYQLAEVLADEVWDEVIAWKPFAQATVGKQLVPACESIGANIAEGDGRYSYKNNKQFQFYARGSLEETRYWLRRAVRRRLISEERFNAFMATIDELIPQLNAYIRSLERRGQTVKPSRVNGANSQMARKGAERA
ncbi:MAG: four helix bundle protein [candidate division NC10 bacterium]|nr:four helix bundle protein [candidate division NC10 bacterium]